MHRSPASGHEPSTDAYMEVRRFLTGADLRPDFADRVLSRIHAEHDRRGTNFLHAPLLELVRECTRPPSTQRRHQRAFADRRARALLTAATQRAGEADVLLCKVRRVLERPA